MPKTRFMIQEIPSTHVSPHPTMKLAFKLDTRSLITLFVICFVAKVIFDFYTVFFRHTGGTDQTGGQTFNLKLDLELIQAKLQEQQQQNTQQTTKIKKGHQGRGQANVDKLTSNLTLMQSSIVNDPTVKVKIKGHKKVGHSISLKVNEFLHREFWRWNATGIISTPLEGAEKKLLHQAFKKPLWGRNLKEGHYGLGQDYDDRVLRQKIWQLRAPEIQPQIFAENKTKVIVLKDSFNWWNYKGGDLLTCPGAFNKRCQMVDGLELDPNKMKVDAVVVVQDAYHNSDAFEFVDNENVFRIFFVLESPFASPRVHLNRRNDLLSSYWRGSDIFTPYSKWVYYDPDVRSKPHAVNYAAGKSKMAAMFVSNCHSMNARLTYVNKLQRHMEVHVYGTCGDLICSKKEYDSCFSKLKKDYRFYLAFENANCRDYITEKYFINALQNNLIPVVMGGHPADYAAIAPHNSFIHVEDFEGPVELAAYLNRLAKDEKAYNKYFEWRGTGEFIDIDFFCRVCSLLFYSEAYPPPGKSKRPDFVWSTHSDAKEPMCVHEKPWKGKKTELVPEMMQPHFVFKP